MANEQIEQGKGKLVESVITRVNELTSKGGFMLPANYAVENAVRAAYFIIGDIIDKNGKSAIEVCTPASISESLFRMTMQGLNPLSLQCYFIIHGNKLTLRRSYMGSISVAKRVAGVKEVTASVIYAGDKFSYEIKNGKIQSVNHEQSIENLDNDIFGAYAIAEFEDGSQIIDVMTIKQIKESWKMSINQSNNKLQTQFGSEAAKRTVINRCLKPIINTSNDSNLYQKQLEDEENEVQEIAHEVVEKPADRKTVSLPSATVKQTIPIKEKEKEPVSEQNAAFPDEVDDMDLTLPEE